MKQLKMLGLGVLAVLLLAALSGAPSAMAVGTELCKADEATCKEANAITTVHEVTPETKKATLLTSSGNVECNVLFSGEITDDATNGSAYVNGNFTYTGCLFKGAACEVKEASKSSLLTIARTEIGETASAKVTGQISVSCGLSISCTFTEEKLAGTAKGALASTLKNGEVSFKEAVIKTSSGTLCPTETKLDMTTAPLAETFLSQGNRYCVRYENSRGRWRFGPSPTECKENVGIQGQNYEEVFSRTAGLTKGTMMCVRDEGETFYLTKAGATCGNLDAKPLGKYELGEIA